MNTILRNYRLLLALTTGFLTLALQFSGASAAFVGGVAAHADIPGASAAFVGGVVAHADIPNVSEFSSHDSFNWAGNEAIGARGTYRAVSANFKVPTISGQVNDHISFWVGVGGDPAYAGSSYELVQAGVDSYIDSSGGQYNYAWYEYVGTSGTISQARIHFNQGLTAGNRIYARVESNYQNSGIDDFYLQNESTGESHEVRVSGFFSDSATGECIGERITQNGSYPPVANFGTEWLNDCTISSNQTTKPVGGWSTNWYHIVNAKDTVLVGIGAIDSNGSFTLNFKQRD